MGETCFIDWFTVYSIMIIDNYSLKSSEMPQGLDEFLTTFGNKANNT